MLRIEAEGSFDIFLSIWMHVSLCMCNLFVYAVFYAVFIYYFFFSPLLLSVNIFFCLVFLLWSLVFFGNFFFIFLLIPQFFRGYFIIGIMLETLFSCMHSLTMIENGFYSYKKNNKFLFYFLTLLSLLTIFSFILTKKPHTFSPSSS